MHISFLLDEFCHHKRYLRGVSPSTITRYREKIGFFIRSSNIQEGRDLNKANVIKFLLNGSMERKWKAVTYNTYYISLQSFFKWCVQQGYLHENPLEDIESPTLPKSLPKSLKKNEARRLLETVQGYPYQNEFLRIRNHCIFLLFLYTGIRKSELINLKIYHIDFESRQIKIEYGKGKRDRIIPIHHVLMPELKRYVDLRSKARIRCPELLINMHLKKGLTDTGLKCMVKQVKEASGVHFTLHILRHTFATLMLGSGCDIYSLSKILGHSDIKTTTIYLASEKKYLRGQFMQYVI